MNIVALKSDGNLFESQLCDESETIINNIKNNMSLDADNAGVEIYFEEMTDGELNELLSAIS